MKTRCGEEGKVNQVDSYYGKVLYEKVYKRQTLNKAAKPEDVKQTQVTQLVPLVKRE